MSRVDWFSVCMFVLLMVVLALFAFLLVVLYLDAREFAADCLRAGGYLAAPGTCIR